MKRLILILTAFTTLGAARAQCTLSVTVNTTTSCVYTSNGTATFTITGGTPPYSYVDYEGLYNPISSGDVWTNLSAYHYGYTITDNAGCTVTDSFYISNSAALSGTTVTESITPSTCDVTPDGSISVTVTGGSGPYTYDWIETVSSSSSLTNLTSGNYTVIINDNADRCSAFYYEVPLAASSTCPGFSGRVFFDVNNNCTFDTGDFPAPYYDLQLDSIFYFDGVPAYYATSDSITGFYHFYAPFGNYQIKPAYSYSFYDAFLDTLCVGHYDVSNSSGTPVVNNLDFPLADNDFCGGGFAYTLQPDCNYNGYRIVSTDHPSVWFMPMDYIPGSYWYYEYGFNSYDVIPPDSTLHLLVKDPYSGCTEYITVTTGPAIIHADSLLSFNITDEHCGFGHNGAITLTDATGLGLHYQWSTGDSTTSISGLSEGYYFFQAQNGSACVDTFLSVGINDSLCPHIAGRVFYDINNNCTFDPGIDSIYNSACYTSQVIVNGSVYISTNADGTFTYACAPGTYNLHCDPAYCGLDSISYSAIGPCVSDVLVTLDSTTAVSDTVYFALNPLLPADVSVNCYGWGAVPGFNMSYQIYYQTNYSTTSGKVYCVLDDSLTFVSAEPAYDYTSGDTLFWNIPSVSFYTQGILIHANIMSDPGLLGSTIDNVCGFIADSAEVNLSNNTCSSSTLVTGSYDPNEKLVSPSGKGPLGYIMQTDSILTYRIDFQNTGSGPAHDIVVKDTISNHLDLSTLQVIDVSHAYTLSLNGNLCTFTFHDIMLPDSTSDEPNSHGHITYRIHLKDDLDEFTAIENTAYIYFDFNPAVVTNTTVNTLNNSLSVHEQAQEKVNPFKVYPNPFHDQLYISSKDNVENFNIKLTDISGKMVMEKTGLTHSQPLQVGDLRPGIYLLIVSNNESSFAYRLVRQ